MKFNKTKLLLVIPFVVAIGLGFTFLTLEDQSDFNYINVHPSIAIAEETVEVNSVGDPLCFSPSNLNSDIMLPSTIPLNYRIHSYDFSTDSTFVKIEISPSSCNESSSLVKGAIILNVKQIPPNSLVANSTENYFQEYLNLTKKPELVSLFQINGFDALSIPATTVTIPMTFTNGTIFYEYESPYPAQILLVDKTSDLIYHLQ